MLNPIDDENYARPHSRMNFWAQNFPKRLALCFLIRSKRAPHQLREKDEYKLFNVAFFFEVR